LPLISTSSYSTPELISTTSGCTHLTAAATLPLLRPPARNNFFSVISSSLILFQSNVLPEPGTPASSSIPATLSSF
jgi:hypothetical protein